MRICPQCKQPPSDPQLIVCQTCKVPFVEQGIEAPLRLTEQDLDRLARCVAESLVKRNLEPLGRHIKAALAEDDWESLAEQVVKRVNIVEDGEKFAKRLIGKLIVKPKVLALAAVSLIVLFVVLMEFGGHVAKEKAVELFNAEMTNQIRLQFREPRISNIIVSVASENATNLMHQQIGPAITAFETALNEKLQTIQSNLNTIQTSAATNVTELRSIANLYMLIAGAQAGNRDDLWKLYALGDDTNAPMRLLANRAWGDIVSKINLSHMLIEVTGTEFAAVAWRGSTNTPETASLDDYKSKLYGGDLPPLTVVALARQFYQQPRFPLAERLAVLAYLAKYHYDLTVINEACHIMDGEAHMHKNFIAANDYVAWYLNWATTNKTNIK